MMGKQALAQENDALLERVGELSEAGQCVSVGVSDTSGVSDAELDALLSAQMVGDPTDGEERLYSIDCDGTQLTEVRIDMVVDNPSEEEEVNDSNNPSISSGTTMAEDGSVISNPSVYYSPSPDVDAYGWLVLRWTKGSTNQCDTYVSARDKRSAQNVADQYIAQGYASTPVHYNTRLDDKAPACK